MVAILVVVYVHSISAWEMTWEGGLGEEQAHASEMNSPAMYCASRQCVSGLIVSIVRGTY